MRFTGEVREKKKKGEVKERKEGRSIY